jgi:nucleotide-binding universal stress UspA family protein
MNSNQILILTDLSDSSEGYINYGVQVAKDLFKSVLLLHVINTEIYSLRVREEILDMTNNEVQIIQEYVKQQQRQSIRKIKKYIKEINSKLLNAPLIDYIIETGIEADIVRDLVLDNKDKIDMIMLRKENEDNDYFIDITKYDIIRKAPCPVWILPFKSNYHSIQRIIYATDYIEEDVPTLKKLVRTFGCYNPDITALHITNNVDFNEKVKKFGFQDLVTERTGYDRINVKTLSNKDEEDIVSIVNSYASLDNADLIVILKENRSFLSSIFEPDPTKKILAQSNIPVLVYHE